MVMPLAQDYEKLTKWIEQDIKKDRAVVNRKILSVVIWCLFLPIFLTLLLFINKKFLYLNVDRYADVLIFLPPLVYVLFSIWPALRDFPRVFSKGGFVALLEDSNREVRWREEISARLNQDLQFSMAQWKLVSFHLVHDLERAKNQNRYMTILSGAVLFLMFQFLDFGGSPEVIHEEGAQAMVRNWVEQFSQWSFQFFALALFIALFYLSGTQFHRALERYLVCVKRIIAETN